MRKKPCAAKTTAKIARPNRNRRHTENALPFLRLTLAISLILLAADGFAQSVLIYPAPAEEVPTRVDGNSPTFWRDGAFHYITSTGLPVIVQGEDQFQLIAPQYIAVDRLDHMPLWIESVWQDPDGTIYGWYHHEPGGICVGNNLTSPEIGAVVSRDGGMSFEDLGIILRSGDTVDCSSKNGFFAGGHGDFSVILNREQTYFYFFFTNYGGGVSGQGIVMARLAFEDRKRPQGAVWKYFEGGWGEPGMTGKVTPIFPARTSWQQSDTDSFWGPAIHWNTYLEKYVILLNHACCQPNWPQEGIYATFTADLSQPAQWTAPVRILQEIGFGPGFYPQAIGLGAGETDTLVGQTARLYIQGRSNWEIVFQKPAAVEPVQPMPEPPREPESLQGDDNGQQSARRRKVIEPLPGPPAVSRRGRVW